ncbi:MAG: hypothetical protein GY847_23505 [Proteobacteria bacterium]|nr:hypothetical protein [Pseudomonadota bacterium]
MRNSVFLLVAIIALHLALALGLQVMYGPSYGFMAGEDCWKPDGQGGWMKHGEPSAPSPAEPSQDIPIPVQYLPIFVPGLVLFAFLFTPLSKKLQPPAPEPEAEEMPEDSDNQDPEELRRT